VSPAASSSTASSMGARWRRSPIRPPATPRSP
jgi:hypothetical protein